MKSEFLKILEERGFIHQCTDMDALDKALSEKGPVTAYTGFDATADSLHVGHLLPIMILHWFQSCGHRPIVLMGGGTSMVGDPSGKDEARQLISEEQIANNIKSIKQIFAKYLAFGEGKKDAVMVNNADWLLKLNYIEFLRDYGRHFSVNRMLSFDSVKIRMDREQSLSFLEFNYMILQGYDFLELNRRYGCTLQMAGSDQWGNIVNGIELTRRTDGKEVFGLTNPLLTTASGAKMGKTAGGAVWLNADRLSAYDFYQYWRNTEDADVGRFLKLFTKLPMDEIAKLESLQGAEINEAKKILAFEVTKLCHGKTEAEQASETARQAFEQGISAEGLPTVEIAKGELEQGIPAFLILTKAGLAESNGEARRLIKGKGARLNDTLIEDENLLVTTAHINGEGVIKLSAGKKKHSLVKAA
jgi:tyrosyl-tRNA synthetase